MSISDILLAINTIILFGIVAYIYAINKYLNKNDIVSYVAKIFEISEANLKQDLYLFLEEVKKEYTNHQYEIIKLLKEQQKETEILKRTIEEETEIFKKYCEERVKFQEEIVNNIVKKLNNATKEISQLKNQLTKCKNKLEKVKNDFKTSR